MSAMKHIIHQHSVSCLILATFIMIVGLGWYFSPQPTHGISLSKSQYSTVEPATLTSSGGPYVIYNVVTGESVSGRGSHDAGDDVNIGEAGDFSIIETTLDGICEDNSYTYQECKDSIYFVGEALFTLITPSGSSGGAAAQNNSPTVSIIAPSRSVRNLKEKVIIEYTSADRDDASANRDSFGLAENPVTIYYISSKNIRERIIIAQNLPAVGSYEWDIKSIAEGSIYIVVEVKDRGGLVSSELSSEFVIDNSAPVFKITASPEASRGEPVQLSVESSEELEGLPKLFVSQNGHEAVQVMLTLSAGRFVGTYEPIAGFDGMATITVSGRDLNGNIGNTISSGAQFAIGVEPPQKPVIISPLDQEVVSTSTITVIGGNARSDVKLSLIVNNVATYETNQASDGTFIFANVKIDPLFNKGVNFIRLIATDQAGNSSEVSLTVKFNISPELYFVTPQAGQILTGFTSLQVAGSDENGDSLSYSFELARFGTNDFNLLARGLASGIYRFDSTQLADGQYIARVLVDDGLEKVYATSSTFSIRNYLPVVTFATGDRLIVNSQSTTIRGTAVSTEVPSTNPNNPTLRYPIDNIEYSLNGGVTWSRAKADDGDFNQNKEDFTITLDTSVERAYPIIVRARDSRGVFGRANILVIADLGPPQAATILSPTAGLVVTKNDDQNAKMAGAQITVSGRAEAGSTVTVYSGGLEVSTITSPTGAFAVGNVSLVKHGANTITVKVTDIAGNDSPVEALDVYYNNAPQVQLISPRSGRGLGAKAKIIWDVRDEDLDPVQTKSITIRRRSGGSLVVIASNPSGFEYDWSVPSDWPSGSYELSITATDGISDTVETALITIDRVKPTITFNQIVPAVFTSAVSLAGSGWAQDDLSGIEFVEYSLDSTNWQAALLASGFLSVRSSFNFRHHSQLGDGIYQVAVRARDGAGNISDAKTQTITVDTTAPRIGSFSFYRDRLPVPVTADNKLIFTTGSQLLLRLSLESDAVMATATVGTVSIPLQRTSVGLWEGMIAFDQVGNYPLAISAADALGNVREGEVVSQIEVIASGQVFYRDEAGAVLPVAGAEIEVWVLDQEAKTFRLWQGESFGSTNPVAVNDQGFYSLLLPAGTYQLRLDKSGFDRLVSSVFTVEANTMIHVDFQLQPSSGLLGWLWNIFN